MSGKLKYYDWERTLSYDADVTMVIGARGIGKTFGLRMQCIRDFIRDGSRFCEIVRFKNSLSVVSDGYYDRLSALPEFEGYMFKTDSRYAWIAERPEEGKKSMWRKAGYFVALSDGQIKKMVTFSGEREAGHHPQRAPTTSAASRSWSAAPWPGTEPPRSGTPPPSPSPTSTARS